MKSLLTIAALLATVSFANAQADFGETTSSDPDQQEIRTGAEVDANADTDAADVDTDAMAVDATVDPTDDTSDEPVPVPAEEDAATADADGSVEEIIPSVDAEADMEATAGDEAPDFGEDNSANDEDGEIAPE